MKGTNDMFSEFYNEVLSYGPSAVLPQNLNSKWLQNVQKIADDFLNTNFNLNEGKNQNCIDWVLQASQP